MVTPYRVWEWDGDRRNLGDDPETRRVLNLLDPMCSGLCALCGSEKSADAVTCRRCAKVCPDPDCKGTPRGVKGLEDEMCRDCANFVRKLDASCRGSTESCDEPECDNWHKRLGPDGSVWCFGEPRERNGYFVYQLETGYVGMTYNPSRRQREHDAFVRYENRLTRYIAGRDDVKDRGAYYRKCVRDWRYTDEDWANDFDEHWKRVG